MKRIILKFTHIPVIFFLFVAGSSAQQISTFSHYHMNRYSYNPAAAGTKDYTVVGCSYGRNWTGFDGAPSIQIINSHFRVNDRAAFGAKIENENTGLSSNMGAEATWAYHLPVGGSGMRFSFGLSGMVRQFRLYKDKLIMHDTDDEAINQASESIIIPDISAGLSIYKPGLFYFDIASVQLLESSVNFRNQEYLSNRLSRHYIVGGGFFYAVNDNIQLEPSVLAKVNENAFWQLDAGLKAMLYKMVSIGCYYRTNDAILPFIGIDTKNISFGYSYGLLINDIAAYSSGSHEISLIVKLNQGRSSLEN